MQIPGISDLLGKGTLPNSLLLLTGPAGVGKSMYCKQFFVEGLLKGDYCIYLSSSVSEKQFRSMFDNIEPSKVLQNSRLINPYLFSHVSNSNESISLSLHRNRESELINKLYSALEEIRSNIKAINDKRQEIVGSAYDSSRISEVRLVVDSLTHLILVFGENAVLQFVTELSFLLKEYEAAAIFTLTLPTSNECIAGTLGSILDGTLEMKLEDQYGSLNRSIRLLSIKGIHHNPSWINFTMVKDGSIVFDNQSNLKCMLCGRAIKGSPIIYSEFSFDTETCIDTYRKLVGVYGANVSEIGLPSEITSVNFFFIDIVGLSDPLLSVKKQIEKIEVLNNLISICDAFRKTPRDKKIVLPTGDGMAIGFLLNPELPLQLSMQLHRELRKYNSNYNKSSDAIEIGVRIGLSSGPVFIVNDINNNQNVWGPGIILARRVMDMGDNLHILLADTMARELITLKDEYRIIINPIADYQIKHGQTVKLYSAYSQDFGNSKLPVRVSEYITRKNAIAGE
jgi:KaiC/GvpD/RAD55 family RecA-like ATPase